MSNEESRNKDDALLATRKALFPHMADMYFDELTKRDLGLPDQYSQPNAIKWAMKVLKNLDSLSNLNGHALRLACIRFRCVKCRLPCEYIEEGKIITYHSPYLFPCGHIIGSSCYQSMISAYKNEGGSPMCP
jgi:hypothetical protein